MLRVLRGRLGGSRTLREDGPEPKEKPRDGEEKFNDCKMGKWGRMLKIEGWGREVDDDKTGSCSWILEIENRRLSCSVGAKGEERRNKCGEDQLCNQSA